MGVTILKKSKNIKLAWSSFYPKEERKHDKLLIYVCFTQFEKGEIELYLKMLIYRIKSLKVQSIFYFVNWLH